MSSFILLVIKIVIFIAILTLFFGLTLQLDFSLIYEYLSYVIDIFLKIINAAIGSIGNYPEIYILLLFLIALGIVAFIVRIIKGGNDND